jgi:hypothetical protein
VENTTETPQFDGSIESAVGLLVEPEEAPEQELEEASAELEEDSDPEETDDSEEDVAEFDDSEEEEVEEDDEGADDADSEEPQFFKVKVDGEEVEVTLEDLKRGYSGQKYVQKGMQEAAAAKKQAEQVYEALLAERQQMANLYQQLQSGNFAQPPSPPTKELFDHDPIGYMEQKMAYDEAKAKYDAQMAEMQKVAAQQSQAQQAAMQAYLQQEKQALMAVMPEFGDAQKATKIRENLVRGGSEFYGYQPEEIGNVMDHRAIMVLKDAVAYRNLMAGKDKAAKKVSGAKPVVKPGSKKIGDGKQKVQQRRKAKLGQSGRIEDALSLVLNQ